MTHYAYIRTTGMYVPETVVVNEDLAEPLDTSDEWIQKRCGIKERRYADVGVANSDIAKLAVENMLSKGEIGSEEIDCMIFATLSPDYHFPGTGLFLQEKLGWADRTIPCYDIRQQCSGFIYGLQMAQAFVETGIYENVLIIGSEVHSHALDYSPRGRAVTVLFGDGAAAVVVSRSQSETSRILVTEAHGDGRGALNGVHLKLFDISKKPIVYYNPDDAENNVEMYPEMPASRNLFANAVRRMAEVSLSVLNRMDLSVDDIDWMLPHQANIRINSLSAEHLGIPEHKVMFNIQKYGNTTAATIPLLLDEYAGDGTIKRGDLLLLVAFGSGFTWGAGLVRY